MPREARLDTPGALHHVICRGIERRKIFRDDQDRDNFVERLGNVLSRTSTPCLAWALIPNHFHLLLKTGKTPIATVMRRLLTGYAVTFNHRHRRHGRLFQNRYKSILCQEEVYLLELVRYIHLNPIRAKLVSSLSDLNRYPYCGHSRLVGELSAEWQDVSTVLDRFGKGLSTARKKYFDFVADGLKQGSRPELTGGGLVRSAGGWKELGALRKANIHLHNDERILGDSDFVEAVLKEAAESLERTQKYRQEGFGFDQLKQLVAEILKIDEREIVAPGKQPLRVRARVLLCFWAVRELGLSATNVAKLLSLTQPAVSKAVQRGEAFAREHGYSLQETRKGMKS
jgi:REP element-mobilizing transposase RayT